MLLETLASLQTEENAPGWRWSSVPPPTFFMGRLLLNSQHHASAITTDAACRRHTNPSSLGANGNGGFPIHQACGHRNSSSDLCKYQTVGLKQKLAKGNAVVFSFPYKDGFTF